MTKSSAPISSPKQPRLSKPSCSPAVAARRALLRRIQRQELRKLQLLIPSMSCRVYRREPDPCTIIDQAIRYIDQLHATVVARVQAGSLPRGEQQTLILVVVVVIEEMRRRINGCGAVWRRSAGAT